MRQNPLKKQLISLVNSYGYETVHNLIREISESQRSFAPTNIPSQSVRAKKAKAKSKPNAIRFVLTMDIDDKEKKNLLMDLATQYEDKQFMPNVDHVRGFLERKNCDVSHIKSRQQVTRKVFKTLAQYDTADLLQVIEMGIYGPPKRLDSYAKAIEGFGQSRRQAAP